jgi:hypothetical protein
MESEEGIDGMIKHKIHNLVSYHPLITDDPARKICWIWECGKLLSVTMEGLV